MGVDGCNTHYLISSKWSDAQNENQTDETQY